MRNAVVFVALMSSFGLVTTLGTANAASDVAAPAPAPAAAGQVTFIPIDRTHVLLAPPPRSSANGTQRKSSAKTFIAPSSEGGGNAGMPIYPPPGTTR